MKKAVFTSSYFGAQKHLGSLSLQIHSGSVHRNLQGTFICLVPLNPEVARAHSQTEPRAHRLRALQARSPVPKAVGSLSSASQMPLLRKKG